MEKKNSDLKDFILLIYKRKKFIIIITLIGVFLSAFLSYFILPPIYKGHTLISVPIIGKDYLPNFTPQDTLILLRSESFLIELSKKTEIPIIDLLPSININLNQNSKLINIEFENKDKEVINKVFINLYYYLNEIIESPFAENYKLLQEQIKKLDNQIKYLEEEEKRIYEKLNNKDNYDDLIDIIFLDNIYNSIITKKISLENQLFDFKNKLLNSKKFEFISGPIINDLPVKPNKILNVTFSGLTSFILSIFIIFLIDYIKNLKEY